MKAGGIKYVNFFLTAVVLISMIFVWLHSKKKKIKGESKQDKKQHMATLQPDISTSQHSIS